MVKLTKFETERERLRRERRESIVKEYLGYADQILRKEVAPGRVFKYLAYQYKMTEYGIGSILKRYGVYESAEKPVVPPKDGEIGAIFSRFFTDYPNQQPIKI